MYCRFQLMRGGMSPREFDVEMEFVQESLAELPGEQWMEYLQAFRLQRLTPEAEDLED
ncbi:hypothetical protein D9M72_363520 [compost metagenome]